MKTFTLACLSVFSLSAFAFQSPEEVPACAGGSKSRAQIVALVAPGETSADIATLNVYTFGRRCHSLSGCPAWQAGEYAVAGSKFGLDYPDIMSLRTQTAKLRVVLSGTEVLIEIIFDSPSFSYVIKGKGSLTRTVQVDKVRGRSSDVPVLDGNINFGSIYAARRSNHGSEGPGFVLYAGQGSAGQSYGYNYVQLNGLSGSITDHGCIDFRDSRGTMIDRDGFYWEYTLIATNR